MPKNVVIADNEIRAKLAVIVAEYTSGIRDAIPEEADFDIVKKLFRVMDFELDR